MLATGTQELSGAQALVAALEQEGIRLLFGVPGHGAYPIYDALNDYPAVRPIVGRNEQGSLFSADGFARVTQDVAVCTSVPLAGVTNSLTSLWEMNGHGSRVLYLVEYDPAHEQFLRPIARHYRQVFAVGAVAPVVHELIQVLRAGRPGVAVLEVPNGVLHSYAAVDPADGFPPRSPSLPGSVALDRAAKLLNTARQPIICADGYGWNERSHRALTRLAESLQAPVLTANMSKGAVAEDHPLALGFAWNASGHAERLLSEADVVLGVGPRAGMLTGQRPAETLARQLIHLDWDGFEQGPNVPAAAQLNGSVPGVLEALADRVVPRRAVEWPDAQLEQVRSAPREVAKEQIPWAVDFYRALRRSLPRDGLLFTDSLAGLWAARLVPAYAPNTVHFPWFTGTLGHGIPAAVGAALANPERPIAVLAGDGAFLYNSQELAVLRQHGLRIVVVVANDNAYGAIRWNMSYRFGRSTAHQLANPDFVQLGQAYGMRALRLNDLAEAEDALQAALRVAGPALIEVPLELRPPRL
jgi:acetolactate synthase-1/2/3 large subunit